MRYYSVPLLLILFLLFVDSNVAISGVIHQFRSGYIITANNDSIHGEIDYQNESLMAKKCLFRINKNGPDQLFHPGDIKAFRFDNDKFFVSRQIFFKKKAKTVFLECLVKGLLSVYYYNYLGSGYYYVEKGNGGLVELTYTKPKVVNVGGINIWKKSKIHQSILAKMTNDAQDLLPMILEIEKPDHKSLIKFANAYNNEVCKENICTVYVKENKVLGYEACVAGGWNQITPLNSKLAITGSWSVGATVNIWIPRTSENFSLKTGIVCEQVSYHDVNQYTIDGVNEIYSIIKVPFMVEYKIPLKVVNPFVGVGLNLDLLDLYTVPLNNPSVYVGADILINENCGFKFIYERERGSISDNIEIYNFNSNNLSLGFYYKFK